jgi:hypothetical protein
MQTNTFGVDSCKFLKFAVYPYLLGTLFPEELLQRMLFISASERFTFRVG